MQCHGMMECENARAAAWRECENARAAAWRQRGGTLQPIVFIGTPAAKCALGSTSILAGIAKFATITRLLTL